MMNENMKNFVFNSPTKLLFGVGKLGELHKEGENCILEAMELGYRLIDTAQMYDNEKIVGNAVRKSGLNRNEIFLTTKLYRPCNSYKKAKQGIEASLEPLQTDYINLLLIHEPYKQDLEIYEALIEAYQQGKVKAIGISNYDADRYEKFIQGCGMIPAVNQVESHVYYPQFQLKKKLNEHGTQMQSWGPFTEGRRNIFSERALMQIGKKYGKTSAQIALRFLIQNNVAVIPKTSRKDRMKQNMDVFDFELSEKDLIKIDTLNGNTSLFGWY